jgi:hypothetical protein
MFKVNLCLCVIKQTSHLLSFNGKQALPSSEYSSGDGKAYHTLFFFSKSSGSASLLQFHFAVGGVKGNVNTGRIKLKLV